MVHLLGAISDAGTALLAVVVTLCLAILGGTVRTAMLTGRVLQRQDDHGDRLEALEVRQHDHDMWHLQHGDRGV